MLWKYCRKTVAETADLAVILDNFKFSEIDNV